MGKTEYSIINFTNALKSSFIDASIESDQRYAPKIVSNRQDDRANVLSAIKAELSSCKTFDFSVAFVSSRGIQVLIQILQELKERGIKGRILTSTFNNFNQPSALRKLLEFPNIETRVYQGDLHAKVYLFDDEDISTIIVGSANLTFQALTCNKEWNVLFRSFPEGDMIRQIRKEYDDAWNDPLTTPVTEDWISEYERYRKPDAEEKKREPGKPSFRLDRAADEAAPAKAQDVIVPNKMQSLALDALDVLHKRREKRALLISATGTGKTYLSAFDVKATRPKSVLFIAHRRRILEASLRSFERVLGNEYAYSMLGDDDPQSERTCTFAMVNTLRNNLEQHDPCEFDYIIIDEAHRAGALGYRAILDHFKPSFCLGMTATPSRTDGYDVYALFNHVIAFRITLQDALEEGMLAPFHYFGISDLEVDDQSIDDVSCFSKLTSEERVRHIVSKIEEYTVEKERRRGLIFCNRNEEASTMSEMFNEIGYRTVAISGGTGDNERNQRLSQLESGELDYIFSVDILNEGIDIPSVNQIIMLRRTDSAIVFVQQLGRGLRKCKGKEYTLVLDFIGNYQSNYLVPMALSGDRTYNKDNLRRIVKEGGTLLPGASTVSFDRISEAKIFKSLEENRFDGTKLLRQEYRDLKEVLGRIPTPLDFDANESIDPNLYSSKFGSYAAFLQKYEPESGLQLGKDELDMLKFISSKLASGKRKEDLMVLDKIMENPDRRTTVDLPSNDDSIRSVARMLSGDFSTSGMNLAEYDEGYWEASPEFRTALSDQQFFEQAKQTVLFGLKRNERLFSDKYKDTDFVLNEKYTREEVCRLLRWSKEPNYQNIGGYFHDKETNTFPVFIDYDKDPSISVTTQYEDRFLSENQLIAISKSNRNLNSPEIRSLKESKENGMRCFLFLRKNKNDKGAGKEFYFLGEIFPTGQFRQFVMKGSTASAVEIAYRLDVPVRADLYDYFLSDLDLES